MPPSPSVPRISNRASSGASSCSVGARRGVSGTVTSPLGRDGIASILATGWGDWCLQAMLAEVVSVRRCCVASIVAAGAFVRLPEPAPSPPPPPPTFHVVPLLGDPLAYDDRCVPFLPEIVRSPNWSL